MTPSFTEFLNVIRSDPEARDALRRELLTQELLELPERFAAFVAATERWMEAMQRSHEELRQSHEELRQDYHELKQGQDELRQGQDELRQDYHELKQGQDELRQGFDNLTLIVTGMREDLRILKAAHAVTGARRDLIGITLTAGCLPVRELTGTELYNMLRSQPAPDISAGNRESFRNADIVIEAAHEDTGETHYFAVEASFTAQPHDIERAVRNAGYLRRFTGQPSHAVVASVDATPAAAQAFTDRECAHYAIPRRHLETE